MLSRNTGTLTPAFSRSLSLALPVAVMLAALALLRPANTANAALPTAYDALRAIGESRGPDFFQRLLAVEGNDGADQPVEWILIFAEPGSSGIREFSVKSGRIQRESTPARASIDVNPSQLRVMNLERLNLNSDGAFQTAVDEATRRRFGFHTINYKLHSAGPNANPTWFLELVDVKGQIAATATLNATDGTVLRFDQIAPSLPPDAAAGPPPPNQPHTEPWSERASRTVRKTGGQIKDTFLNVGGSLEKFFTGKRTIGTKQNR